MGAFPVSHPKQAVEEMALQVRCCLGSRRQLVDAGRMQLQPLGVACYTGAMSKFRMRFTCSPCSKSVDFFFTKLVLGAAIVSSVGLRGGEAGGCEGHCCFLRLFTAALAFLSPRMQEGGATLGSARAQLPRTHRLVVSVGGSRLGLWAAGAAFFSFAGEAWLHQGSPGSNARNCQDC